MKKIIFYIGVFIIVLILVFTGDSSVESSTSTDYDNAYYVEADNNLFIKVAKLCDEASYYIVDIVLKGIDSVFSLIGGN